jgi:hypothetical protein
MRSTWGRMATAIVAGLATLTVSAEAALEPEILKLYGGTYLSDCAHPASPRVTVFENDIVFLQGDRRVAATNVEAQHSFFGQSAPPGFLVALSSESGPNQLLALIYQDESGTYLQIDGDPPLMAQVGKAAQGLKYRRCSSSRTAPPAGKPAPSTGAGKKAPVFVGATAGAMFEDPIFKASYARALGKMRTEPWLANLDGPSPETRAVRFEGADYLLVSACKNHDCSDYNVVLLYSRARRAVYGLIQQKGHATLLGSPSPTMAKELGRLWRADWRKNP